MEYTERLCSCGTKIRSGKHCLECLQEKVDRQERERHEAGQEVGRK
jgi:hypothetical protein